ncbi:MAG: hypothetical protein V4564_18620 [Pseudomonadota bacterium]|uniref:hypothetical protein n=1 Tax=Sphingomonas sp. ERG5 TaxID=1381597 RepID=UPI00126A188D|nr:hypothetical protein [Sphingomonas sp. ERG5]
MTARYLTSDFQRSLITTIDSLDRSAVDFFVSAPLVIDCSNDRAVFESQLTATQRAFIVDSYKARGRFVSWLARPAYNYTCEKLRERFRLLDQDAVEKVRIFLLEWRKETGRMPYQPGKSASLESGIDIILPIEGIRLSYDLSAVREL